ncbi:hypothetical protein [Hydrogenophaga sp.]|uniref:hypothetical protein n=1 Tax=Hydrogenophaga sp. TaxID=1904254 RepID=UPI00271FD2BD|nr:hypothetical protein [Hydrogenophaga sp.]MDO9435012.1 hypothetical protein [Hydrogenophaga sp.]
MSKRDTPIVPRLVLRRPQSFRAVREALGTDIKTSSGPGAAGKGANTLSRPTTPPSPESVPFKMTGDITAPSGHLDRTVSTRDFLTMEEAMLDISREDLEGTDEKNEREEERSRHTPRSGRTSTSEDGSRSERPKTPSPRSAGKRSAERYRITGTPSPRFIITRSNSSVSSETPREQPSPRTADTATTTTTTTTTNTNTNTNTTTVSGNAHVDLQPLPLQTSGAGPIHGRFTEWDDMASEHPQTPYAITTAAPMSQRTSLLDDLLRALDMGLFTQASAHLAAIPAEVEHLDRYFPPAPLTRDVGTLLKRAEQLVEQTGTASSRRLLAFISDCQLRATAQHKVVSDQQHVTDKQLKKIYPPDVRHFCIAIRDAPDARLDAHPSPFLKRIILAMESPRLMAALAAQPYVNLRLLQLKCTVVAAHLGPKLANGLLKAIQEAREFQKNGSLMLKEQLLQPTLSTTRIAALALMEYAKQMTSLPIDYVSAGATWDEVLVMTHGMQTTYEHYLSMDPETVNVELAALRWVTRQIIDTHRLQYPEPD